MKRRTFLEVTTASAAAGMLLPRSSWAAPFGEFPANAIDTQLPASLRATRVLEVFLYGGLSPWETLYTVEEYGQANQTMYYSPFPSNANPDLDATIAGAVTRCGGGSPA